MKTSHILLLSSFMLLAVPKAISQYSTTLYNLENLPQRQFLNPALMPRANGFFGIPVVNTVAFNLNSDVAFKNVFQEASKGEWVTPTSKRYDYDKLYNAIGKSIDVDAHVVVTPFFLGFRAKRNYFTFSVTEHAKMHIGLPGDFVKMGDKGLADGETFDLAPLSIKAMAYREIALGFAREWNDKLTIGVKLKPLFGHVAVTPKFKKIDVSTSAKQWDLDYDATYYSSLPITVTEPANDDEAPEVEELDLETEDLINRYAKGFSNPGFAVDLGAEYKFSEKWWFSASLIDFGGIRWNRDLNSVNAKGQYTYDGVEIDLANTDEDQWQEIADSLNKVTDYTVGHEKFSTPLSPMVYAAARYNLTHTVSLGLLSRSTFNKYNFRQEFNASANFNFYRGFTFCSNFNYRVNGSNYLGLGLADCIGPLQIYFMFDHMPLRYSMMESDGSKFPISENLKDVNIMFGINLLFGKKGYRDSPMLGMR